MTIRHCAALLIAVLALSLFSGCGLHAALRKADAIDDVLEHRIDTAEDAMENAVQDAIFPKQSPASSTSNIIDSEDAKSIALAHAGLTADRVQFLRADFDIDDRIPQYDIDFMADHLEYEYEIHAETGDVLSFDMDR